MLWYISGPMTDIPKFNFPVFAEAAKRIRALGFRLVSPHECDPPEMQKLAWASPDGSLESVHNIETAGEIYGRDVTLIIDCIDGIILLPDWGKSKGARLEVFTGLLFNKEFRAYNACSDEPIEFLSKEQVRFALHRVMP